MATPKDFRAYPYSSVLHKNEYEVIAQNIMKILSRTGNAWRTLSLAEYIEERGKDSKVDETERIRFVSVSSWCVSEEQARLFSNSWLKISSRIKREEK